MLVEHVFKKAKLIQLVDAGERLILTVKNETRP